MRASTGQYFVGLDHVRALAAFLVFTWHFMHIGGGHVEALPGTQEGQQLVDHRLAALHFRLGALESELVSAQADVGIEQLLEGAQMFVVLADQKRRHIVVEVDMLGHVFGAHAASPPLTSGDPRVAGPGSFHADRRSLTKREAVLPSTVAPP